MLEHLLSTEAMIAGTQNTPLKRIFNKVLAQLSAAIAANLMREGLHVGSGQGTLPPMSTTRGTNLVRSCGVAALIWW